MYHVPRSSKTESLIETPLQIYSSTLVILYLEMHDEIFHFEMFKKNHENFEISQDPFLKYFMKLLIFNIK